MRRRTVRRWRTHWREWEDRRKKPTIIVVMSESYADLSVVGDFSTNREATPFYDSLTENTMKGYALSSVFGAKTPNSEWEFMTGNSMAFPAGRFGCIPAVVLPISRRPSCLI